MGKRKGVKITDKLVNYFKLRIRYWAERNGLHSWRINFCHTDTEDYVSCVTTDYPNRAAWIEITQNPNAINPDSVINEDYMDRTALHECYEILFSPLRDKLQEIYNPELVSEWIHTLIVTLVTERLGHEQSRSMQRRKM